MQKMMRQPLDTSRANYGEPLQPRSAQKPEPHLPSLFLPKSLDSFHCNLIQKKQNRYWVLGPLDFWVYDVELRALHHSEREGEMYPSLCRSCLAFLLKFLNYLQTVVGVSVILYAVWMLSHWHWQGLGLDPDKLQAPWFVCSMMGLGVLICLISLTGHIAARAINGCCLCFYAVLTTMIILLEAVLVGDVVFNKHWEEDLPYDYTGELKRLRAFIDANINICKWIAVALVIVQAVSLLLAIILRDMLQPTRMEYDSDEDFAIAKKPLLNPHGDSTIVSTSVDIKDTYQDTWKSRLRQKYGLNPS